MDQSRTDRAPTSLRVFAATLFRIHAVMLMAWLAPLTCRACVLGNGFGQAHTPTLDTLV